MMPAGRLGTSDLPTDYRGDWDANRVREIFEAAILEEWRLLCGARRKIQRLEDGPQNLTTYTTRREAIEYRDECHAVLACLLAIRKQARQRGAA